MVINKKFQSFENPCPAVRAAPRKFSLPTSIRRTQKFKFSSRKSAQVCVLFYEMGAKRIRFGPTEIRDSEALRVDNIA